MQVKSLRKLLSDIAEKNPKRFMTPGHKGGAGFSKEFHELLHNAAGRMDLSLPDEEWHWRNQEGVVYQSEQRFAELYGVKRTFFALNGTTGAIHAMLMASVNAGSKIILPRNVHRSVVAAMILVDVQPLYILPEFSKALNLWMPVTKNNVTDAIAVNKDAEAILLVHPNYYGIACDVAEIAKAAHEQGMKVLVDEAHGAHLKFSLCLPLSAVETGADVVAQSTHKILGSLVQSSVLHCTYDSMVDDISLAQAMYLLQTSSPNYLLAASLEATAQDMQADGETLINSAVNLANRARGEINGIEGLSCFGEEVFAENFSYIALDATKLTISVEKLGITGYEAEKYLWSEENLQVELADECNILLLITFADDEGKIFYLLAALKKMAEYYMNNTYKMKQKAAEKRLKAFEAANDFAAILPKAVLTPRQAYFSKKKKVLLSEAAGEIAAETISFYPPGIPIISYGEIISKELLEYCSRLKRCGAAVSSMEDGHVYIADG